MLSISALVLKLNGMLLQTLFSHFHLELDPYLEASMRQLSIQLTRQQTRLYIHHNLSLTHDLCLQFERTVLRRYRYFVSSHDNSRFYQTVWFLFPRGSYVNRLGLNRDTSDFYLHIMCLIPYYQSQLRTY